VPTVNEASNVAELVARLSVAVAGQGAEALFVDDSTDDTPVRVIEVAAASVLPVRPIHPTGEQRTAGLAGAVSTGTREARSNVIDVIDVIDGDLQHPPELVAELISVREIHDGDVVVASRYRGQSAADGLSSSWRHAVSPGSTLLARALFPRRVGRTCSDPMTGLFCLNRRGIDSKASWRQGAAFLAQLAGLRLHWPQTRSTAIPLPEPVREGGWPARPRRRAPSWQARCPSTTHSRS
jgi:dolichol-phosphate mannosyltransferase